eukprot:4103739-Amphidinium_carterae.1
MTHHQYGTLLAKEIDDTFINGTNCPGLTFLMDLTFPIPLPEVVTGGDLRVVARPHQTERVSALQPQ